MVTSAPQFISELIVVNRQDVDQARERTTLKQVEECRFEASMNKWRNVFDKNVEGIKHNPEEHYCW